MLEVAARWRPSLCGWFVAWVLFAACAPLPAQDPELNVRPGGERSLIVIAVPEFKSSGAQALQETKLADVMQNDFRLSGFFQAPSNKEFVVQTDQLDQQRGGIQFAEWQRLGAFYLVKGSYAIQGQDLTAKVETYDTVAQKYIFGRSYEGYKVDQARTLAHRISDDIVQQLTATPGVARTRLLFVKEVDPLGKTKQIGMMDADGANQKTVTDMGELTAAPCWGANGTEIYYTTYRDFNPDLAGLILRTNHKWWVSRRAGFNLSPSWNESRKEIALTFTRDGNSEIYTITREGRNPNRLTFERAIDGEPSWNRDGSQIVFTSDRGGRPQIFIMDVASKVARRLTYQGEYNTGAVWSPAGPERIAFQSRLGGVFQIMTMNPDGSDVRQVTSGPYNNEDPTWAPNGALLAFTSDRTGKRQIYSIFADGGEAHQLTQGTPCKSPAWSPMLP